MNNTLKKGRPPKALTNPALGNIKVGDFNNKQSRETTVSDKAVIAIANKTEASGAGEMLRVYFKDRDKLDEAQEKIGSARKELNAKIKNRLGIQIGTLNRVAKLRKLESSVRSMTLQEEQSVLKAVDPQFVLPGIIDYDREVIQNEDAGNKKKGEKLNLPQFSAPKASAEEAGAVETQESTLLYRDHLPERKEEAGAVETQESTPEPVAVAESVQASDVDFSEVGDEPASDNQQDDEE
jgi:hypothetical protein